MYITNRISSIFVAALIVPSACLSELCSADSDCTQTGGLPTVFCRPDHRCSNLVWFPSLWRTALCDDACGWSQSSGHAYCHVTHVVNHAVVRYNCSLEPGLSSRNKPCISACSRPGIDVTGEGEFTCAVSPHTPSEREPCSWFPCNTIGFDCSKYGLGNEYQCMRGLCMAPSPQRSATGRLCRSPCERHRLPQRNGIRVSMWRPHQCLVQSNTYDITEWDTCSSTVGTTIHGTKCLSPCTYKVSRGMWRCEIGGLPARIRTRRCSPREIDLFVGEWRRKSSEEVYEMTEVASRPPQSSGENRTEFSEKNVLRVSVRNLLREWQWPETYAIIRSSHALQSAEAPTVTLVFPTIRFHGTLDIYRGKITWTGPEAYEDWVKNRNA